jgi:hypothetical protein
VKIKEAMALEFSTDDIHDFKAFPGIVEKSTRVPMLSI